MTATLSLTNSSLIRKEPSGVTVPELVKSEKMSKVDGLVEDE